MSRNETLKAPADVKFRMAGPGHSVRRKCAACSLLSASSGGGSYPIKGSTAVWHCAVCTRGARGDTNYVPVKAARVGGPVQVQVCPGYTGDVRLQVSDSFRGEFGALRIGEYLADEVGS